VRKPDSHGAEVKRIAFEHLYLARHTTNVRLPDASPVFLSNKTVRTSNVGQSDRALLAGTSDRAQR